MIDRRVQKTLDSLHQALIALILEKGYDAITVKDIIDRANVGRSTFYTHYLSKEHLLQGGLDDLGKVLLANQKLGRTQVGKAAVRFAFSSALFDHAHGYKNVYRAMVGKHAGAVVTNRLSKVLTDLVKEDLSAIKFFQSAQNVPPSVMIQFIVGAIMSVLTWWVDEPKEHTAEEVDAIFRRLTFGAIDFPNDK
jgi:AcrR family transcriptional regulator